MQLRPDAPTLLEAVAEFLLTQVHPAMADKSLAFKVMIAANLCQTLSGELSSEDERYAAEVTRLMAIVPDVVPPDAAALPTRAARHAALGKLNNALADRLRSNALSDQQRALAVAHATQTALETLAYANPRFDTSADVA